MSRLTVLLPTLALLLATGPAMAQYWLDGAGRVYTIDSFGRIAIDRSSTSWRPGTEQLDLQVTEEGDAYYTDSFGRLCRNGSELGQSWLRKHYFKLDRQGNLYTVKDWVTDKILKNGGDTGYEIRKGSGLIAGDSGNVYYTSERTGNFCVNGRDTGHPFDRDDCVEGPDGDLYFVNFHPNQMHNFWLFRYTPSTGQIERVAWLASRQGFAFDARGNLWMAETGWRITKNGIDTGWRGPGVHLDRAGNCYHADNNGRIHRNGIPTGFVTRGSMRVSAGGHIVYVGDSSDRELYRDGRPLGIYVGESRSRVQG